MPVKRNRWLRHQRTSVGHRGYIERLEPGIEPSVGRVGDSYDNALAEYVIGLDKTEVIRQRGPWHYIEAVEFVTLKWVHWFNHRRFLEAPAAQPAEVRRPFRSGCPRVTGLGIRAACPRPHSPCTVDRH